MAYLPAGEEDDFDSDDGFIDNDPSFQNETERLGFSSGTSTGHILNDNRNAADGKSVSWSQSGSSFPDKRPETNVLPCHSTNVLSMEDFRMAVVRCNSQLVERCLDQGLDVDTPLRCGWTVLMYAGSYSQPHMVTLLLGRGANPNCHCDMFTALMCACSACSHDEAKIGECIQILAGAGADVNAQDRFHTTALMLSSREGHVAVVRDLIKHGADVNRQDSRGWTALTWATQRAAKDVVLELLSSGADPNIQHLDKLTVKDLAAHLPTDEMLALLEHRPANLTGGAGDMESHADKGTVFRSRDVRYGELEVLLLGLGLSHLVSLFQQQLIDLDLLMTLTEQDLINAGVDQIGARKKLLDAIQALHKKDWQPSSLVSIHFNKKICCSDAVAILANSSKHLRYIGSTIVYVREQLRRHPEQVTRPTEQVDSRQLVRHTQDAIKNVQVLTAELDRLQSQLAKEIGKRNVDPPDVVDDAGSRKTAHMKNICCCVLVGLCVSSLVWYRRENLLKHLTWITTRSVVW